MFRSYKAALSKGLSRSDCPAPEPFGGPRGPPVPLFLVLPRRTLQGGPSPLDSGTSADWGSRNPRQCFLPGLTGLPTPSPQRRLAEEVEKGMRLCGTSAIFLELDSEIRYTSVNATGLKERCLSLQINNQKVELELNATTSSWLLAWSRETSYSQWLFFFFWYCRP